MRIVLEDWEHTYSREFYEQLPQNWQRRSFLSGTAKAAAVLALTPLLMQLSACKRRDAPETDLRQPPWPTFAAVHDVLFPADGNGPSAHDIQATRYLRLVLQTPGFDAEERTFILEGIGWLDQYAREKSGKAFLDMNAPQRDAVLRAISDSRAGERWLDALLNYVLEALLCDPVYGGNPHGIGWQWLQHQPGFPRPAQACYLETQP